LATWKRLPTTGHPGGPGGRRRGDLDFFDWWETRMRKDEIAKAKEMKMRW